MKGTNEYNISHPNTLTPENIIKREKAIEEINTFDDLSELIDLKIIRGVIAYGFENPSPIQQKAIPAILAGKDILGIAQTGSGKTASFVLPVLQMFQDGVGSKNRHIKALVLVPTRELAIQVSEVVKTLSSNLPSKISMLASSLL